MDPDPDPTPFFSDIKDAKKLFFSFNLPTGTLSLVLIILFFTKIVLKFYFASIISFRSAP
jgi:hypothetical protein